MFKGLCEGKVVEAIFARFLRLTAGIGDFLSWAADWREGRNQSGADLGCCRLKLIFTGGMLMWSRVVFMSYVLEREAYEI